MSRRMFESKSVLITGGAQGIGQACAVRFGEEGAKVCVADIDLKRAEGTAQIIRSAGNEAFAIKVDVSLEEDNARMVSEILARFGDLDIAILNAAILGELTNLFESNIANFDRVYAINQRGCYLGLKATSQVMRRGGVIIITSSVAGLRGWNHSAAYSASKHAVIGIAQSVAESLATREIRINVVCPGVVNTRMVGDEFYEEPLIPSENLKMPPYRGTASPQQLAEPILFLASSRASYMTGGVYVVDGGWTCGVPKTMNG